MSTAWFSTNGRKPAASSSCSPVRMGTRAARAAHEPRDGQSGNFSRDVPQRDIDAAHGWNVREVWMSLAGHRMKKPLDGERVLADEQRLEQINTRARKSSVRPRFAVAGQA